MVCPRLSKIMISLCCNRGACFPWHWRCCWKQSKRFQRGGGPRPPKAGHRDPPFARHWNLYLQIRRLRRVYHSDLALCYFVDCRLSYSFHMTWLRNILWWRYQMYEVWLETKSFGFLHCNFPPCFREALAVRLQTVIQFDLESLEARCNHVQFYPNIMYTDLICHDRLKTSPPGGCWEDGILDFRQMLLWSQLFLSALSSSDISSHFHHQKGTTIDNYTLLLTFQDRLAFDCRQKHRM